MGKADDDSARETAAAAKDAAAKEAAAKDKDSAAAKESAKSSAAAREAASGGAGAKAAAAKEEAGTRRQDQGSGMNKLEAARTSAADSLTAKSQTLMNMDPEMRADMTNDVLTEHHEKQQRGIRERNEKGSPERLQELHEAVMDAQKDVDIAVRKRDLARDEHDREAERIASNSGERNVLGEFVTAQHAAREKEAQRVRRMQGD